MEGKTAMAFVKSDCVEEVHVPRNSLVMEEVRVGYCAPSRNSVTMEDVPPENEPAEADRAFVSQKNDNTANTGSTSRNSVTMADCQSSGQEEENLSFEQLSQSLETKLKSRPPSGELEQSNIIKGSILVSPTLSATQQELKFKQTQITLERKLRSRPASEELQQSNIIKDENASTFNELQDTLESKLNAETRPMINDLVRLKILKENPLQAQTGSRLPRADIPDTDEIIIPPTRQSEDSSMPLLRFHRTQMKGSRTNASTTKSNDQNTVNTNSTKIDGNGFKIPKEPARGTEDKGSKGDVPPSTHVVTIPKLRPAVGPQTSGRRFVPKHTL